MQEEEHVLQIVEVLVERAPARAGLGDDGVDGRPGEAFFRKDVGGRAEELDRRHAARYDRVEQGLAGRSRSLRCSTNSGILWT